MFPRQFYSSAMRSGFMFGPSNKRKDFERENLTNQEHSCHSEDLSLDGCEESKRGQNSNLGGPRLLSVLRNLPQHSVSFHASRKKSNFRIHS
ncbi:hypothetical protein NPIL_155261 [Nephila pilipes]|uniref:Uncharacterized protein n=1 Tax=Nephila pilipes TaxID=299642 RepID=A0A8X6T921_NEPPI|nr:hypothetical protein NPIL_155261 [Nephila pilipes]